VERETVVGIESKELLQLCVSLLFVAVELMVFEKVR